MNVHITSIPGFPTSVLNEVGLLLNQTPGELEFVIGKPLSVHQCSLKNPKFQNHETIESLNFDELFGLCDAYRAKNDVTENEWVVLLTTIINTKNWFSAFNGRNIFIDALGWEYYTKRDDKYGISYQVVENIFQSLIELNIDNVFDEPNIHMEPIGCINDMCIPKKDVMFKLRTADICESCIKRAVEKNVNPLVLDHISRIIRNLRENFVNSQLIETRLTPEKLLIDSLRSVTIGEKSVTLDPLNKVVFIFFLQNLEGVETKHISMYSDELKRIYKEVRDNPNLKTIDRMVAPENNTLRTVKRRLNLELVNQLGPNLAEYYILVRVEIRDGLNKYKINLDKEYITIEPPKKGWQF